MNLQISYDDFEKIIAEAVALGYLKYRHKLSPIYISANRAGRIYGHSNLKKWIDGKCIEGKRRGSERNSPIEFSLSDLEEQVFKEKIYNLIVK